MTDYHFVSTWRLQAPIEQAWEEIVHTERWPSWWKYVARVDQLNPGDATGLGRRHRTRPTPAPGVHHPAALPARLRHPGAPHPATHHPGGRRHRRTGGRRPLDTDPRRRRTLVRYDWDVRTTKWWMNLAAPVARPVFTWNHDALMREAAQGLAHRLDAELALPHSGSRAGRPARAFAWACLLLALLVVIVVRWRRRA
jgi:hypothetical protein